MHVLMVTTDKLEEILDSFGLYEDEIDDLVDIFKTEHGKHYEFNLKEISQLIKGE